jgi:coproporphyrinogen III oxidase-like Fe-S oxidoreductase
LRSRTKNWSNTRLYCERLEQGQRAIESHDSLPPLGRAGEIAAFGLRMNVGWPFDQFTAVTGFDLRHEWDADMTHLVGCGWAERSETAFRLNHAGLRYADAAAVRMLRS